ncbi:hypothetical protein [Bacillus sp. FJAT-22090]|uniref:hypothetical protein n=1 Tax=Bacillus sp. FJAT-22090 TaxID=1581038 RepID=UPI0011A9EBD8|nr:hypothetical protein [Bacillus sp. FJAT-22090]
MALGIFLLGAIHQFPILNNRFGLPLSGLLGVTWLLMLFSFFRSLINRDYRNNLVTFPIKSFGAGTWIAASSVIGDLIIQRAPNFLPLVKVLASVNIIMWVFFIIFCVRQLKMIINKQEIENTHGVILLSTVSTQSIVSLLINVYGNNFAPTLMFILISIGALFYLFSFTLLFIRFSSKLDNIHEWKNTDCIIHGAISITGLAMVQSGIFTYHTIIFVWYIVFVLFTLVEIIEVIRGIKRVKEFGWRKGIFTYNITQWARNFTFGMFYFFTTNLLHTYSTEALSFQNHFLQVLGWLVLFLLIIQFYLFLCANLFMKKNKS